MEYWRRRLVFLSCWVAYTSVHAQAWKPTRPIEITVSSLNLHQGDAHWIGTMNVALLTNEILGASKLSYRELTPLAMLVREYVAVWTHADSPIKSMKDLIARLRAQPSALSFGMSP